MVLKAQRDHLAGRLGPREWVCRVAQAQRVQQEVEAAQLAQELMPYSF
jgi:hypothetical protein